jgi:hypothetical protein
MIFHLQPDSAIEANFERPVIQTNLLRPDLIVTDGDMFYTAENVDEKKGCL